MEFYVACGWDCEPKYFLNRIYAGQYVLADMMDHKVPDDQMGLYYKYIMDENNYDCFSTYLVKNGIAIDRKDVNLDLEQSYWIGPATFEDEEVAKEQLKTLERIRDENSLQRILKKKAAIIKGE